MVLTAARHALSDLFDPELRNVFWKSIGFTLLGLTGLWFIIRALFVALALPFFSDFLPTFPSWASSIGFFASVFAGLALAFVLSFLIGPVSAAIAGFFLDDVAKRIEEKHYSDQPIGTATPFVQTIWLSVKFAGVVLVGNMIALSLLWVPGINLIAFFAVNAVLLSREYFQFAAMRFSDALTVSHLRKRHATSIVCAGVLIAGILIIPVVNLLAPFFGAALMVHLHKNIYEKSDD